MNRTAQTSLFEKAKNLPQQSINVAAYRGEGQLLRVLCFLLALAIAGYLYFVGLSILNVIGSREAALESERLQSEVASLEQQYFALSKEVTAEAAADRGLVSPVETAFVRSTASVASNKTQSDI